jgi:hypothetical protein
MFKAVSLILFLLIFYLGPMKSIRHDILYAFISDDIHTSEYLINVSFGNHNIHYKYKSVKGLYSIGYLKSPFGATFALSFILLVIMSRYKLILYLTLFDITVITIGLLLFQIGLIHGTIFFVISHLLIRYLSSFIDLLIPLYPILLKNMKTE